MARQRLLNECCRWFHVVYAALKARHELSGRPEEGWVFPSNSREGHLNKDTAKDQHATRSGAGERNIKVSGQEEAEVLSALHPAAHRTDTACECRVRRVHLARIAGHSSITITQRYVHPQADAIERAFAPLAALPSCRGWKNQKSSKVGTNLGTVENRESSHAPQVIGAKGGTRTPTGFPARS